MKKMSHKDCIITTTESEALKEETIKNFSYIITAVKKIAPPTNFPREK